MCTVTFVPGKDGIFLTSNRDEWHTRTVATVPAKYENKKSDVLLYPRDNDKGGTWIVAKNNGDAAVLLNGAFKPHMRKLNYRQSRGVVLLEIINADSPLEKWKQLCLDNIEPFTLILYADNQLNECRWDGIARHTFILCKKAAYIWSSVTLYDSADTQQRNEWFLNWQKAFPDPDKEEILDFHRTAGTGDAYNSLVMSRSDAIATVSITTMQLTAKKITMAHQDIKNGTRTKSALLLQESIPTEKKRSNHPLLLRLKSIWIRFRHWEYWPFDLLYLPIYFYWIWLSVKARSFFFFSAANPLIKNAGFLMESKKEIYDQLPQTYYPLTIICKNGITLNNLEASLKEKHIKYPFIAKPDIGQRGMQVKLIQSTTEMEEYIAGSQVDFLIQEFIPYKNEIGLFYYRIPGERKGKISGIVGKEFITVTGNGYSTIEELLAGEQRYLLQLPSLKKSCGKLLSTILGAGDRYEFVPYGNHSRGAKFIDLSNLVTPSLEETIDIICQSIPEFYYGRLDIKYASWEDLCKGINFSIIELNGAGSEPTHIYDPVHSVFFAWKEITRHLKLLYRISKANAEQKKIKLMTTRDGLSLLRENKKYLQLLKITG